MSFPKRLAFAIMICCLLAINAAYLWASEPPGEFQAFTYSFLAGVLPFTTHLVLAHFWRNASNEPVVAFLFTLCVLGAVVITAIWVFFGFLEQEPMASHRAVSSIGVQLGIFIGVMWFGVDLWDRFNQRSKGFGAQDLDDQ